MAANETPKSPKSPKRGFNLLAHNHGHSRVVNTGYGLGDINTAATLQGGVAQGANSSPYLFIVVTLIAHLYSAAVLQGYPLTHPISDDNTTPAPADAPTQPTVSIHLVNYADDDAGVNGGPAANQQQALNMLQNMAVGAEALTIRPKLNSGCYIKFWPRMSINLKLVWQKPGRNLAGSLRPGDSLLNSAEFSRESAAGKGVC